MKSINKIIIQNALVPYFTYLVFDDTTEQIETYTNITDWYNVLKDYSLTNLKEIYINKGPGSYTGIRTAIGYTLGLLNGLNNTPTINVFTSFDLIRFIFQHKKSIFIKSWPRIASTELSLIKGYYENGKNHSFVTLTELSEKEDLFVYTEFSEELNIFKDTYITSSQGLLQSEKFTAFISQKELFTNDLSPLYINPVNITS